MQRIRSLFRTFSLHKIGLITIPMIICNYNQHRYQCFSEIKQLNQHMFIQEILGNRKDYFFLVIYKEQVDGGYGELEALQVAKKLKEMSEQFNGDCHVYTISRPQLQSITKLVNRVKNIKIYDEEDSEKIEIFFKTPHSDDYVYFPFKKHSFYSEKNYEKILTRTQRFQSLFNIVNTQEELDDIILENFYQLDSPILIKAQSEEKSLKSFKKIGFQLLERKVLNQNSKFVIINNQQICKNLNLNNDDILIFRNDILQKYENCNLNEQNQLIPQIITKEKLKEIVFESFLEWKKINILNKDQSFADQLQQFLLPRISYLKNSKKSAVGQLIKKIQNHHCQDDRLILSLQLDPQSQNRIDYQIRLQTFFKLYQKYKHKCIFMISATNQLEELLPHLNKMHSNFVLFNIFNSIQYQKQLFPNTAKLYEKYFITDTKFIERYENIEQHLSSLLNDKDRINKIDYLSQNLDRIQEINLDYFNFLQKQDNKSIILYYSNDMFTDVLLKILKDLPFKIYTLSNLNQIPSLYTEFDNQNVLIIGNTAIGFPFSQDVDLMELKTQVINLINQYL